MRKWKELARVPYPTVASVAEVAHGLISRHRYAVEVVAVGYNTPTNYASMNCVVRAAPCPDPEVDYGAVGPGAPGCKAVLDAGYRDYMSVSDAIELVYRCVMEIRQLGLPGASNEFAVWYIDRHGAVPVKKEIMEAMARGRQMATEFLSSSGLDSHQISLIDCRGSMVI